VGGADADRFVFRASDFATGFAFDTIEDFTSGVDVIELSGFVGISSAADVNIVEDGGNIGILLPGGVIFLSNLGSVDDIAIGDIEVVANGTDFTFDGAGPDLTLTSTTDSFVTLDNGPNVINGGDGNDFISAGGGNDTIIGGTGGDQLFGRAGDDVLDGGAGADLLTGGSGMDTFIFRAADAPTGSFVIDTVADFVSGVDTLSFIGFEGVTQFSDLGSQVVGSDLLLDLGGSRFVRLTGLDDVNDIVASDTLFA
jgi:Ca2+-binding RTX toxin-like protein